MHELFTELYNISFNLAVKAHAIFVANLPMTATVEELDKLFKQFGSIKRDGIQVRSNKVKFKFFLFISN